MTKRTPDADAAEADAHGLALFDCAALDRQELPAPALYVVATPIGNAADVTLRALWVLGRVDAIAAEDTRATRPLLARFGIHAPLFAAHRHNEAAAASSIVERLAGGARIALVSDAGSPGISDPGALVVRAVRAAGYRVVPVPGASSPVAAACAAGLRATALHIEGFLPRARSARSALLSSWSRDASAAYVIFEAPHRVRETAVEIAATFDAARPVVVAREITKRFESIELVAAGELPEYVARAEREGAARGEFVLIIDAPVAADDGAGVASTDASIDATTRRWLDALAGELPAPRLASLASKASGLPRDLIYRTLAGRRDGGA
ncbi:MAG TPA: 16S rRNA (cytidine(1402)-2'-O)-methyltransferase [Burkholderiaceae bacterium]|nr:16S rRNA (cytidine(1402)-2'-O)-methyltransferase [Burkholderiaceae bacterium]